MAITKHVYQIFIKATPEQVWEATRRAVVDAPVLPRHRVRLAAGEGPAVSHDHRAMAGGRRSMASRSTSFFCTASAPRTCVIRKPFHACHSRTATVPPDVLRGDAALPDRLPVKTSSAITIRENYHTTEVSADLERPL